MKQKQHVTRALGLVLVLMGMMLLVHQSHHLLRKWHHSVRRIRMKPHGKSRRIGDIGVSGWGGKDAGIFGVIVALNPSLLARRQLDRRLLCARWLLGRLVVHDWTKVERAEKGERLLELFRRDRTLLAMFIMTMNENGSGAGVARDVGNK